MSTKSIKVDDDMKPKTDGKELGNQIEKELNRSIEEMRKNESISCEGNIYDKIFYCKLF